MPGIMEPVTEAEIEAQDGVDDPPHPKPRKRIDPRRIDPRRIDPRRIDKVTLAFSLVIAIGLVLIGRGLAVSLTGDDRANLPETIESVEPFPEAVQVLSQTRVFVDLVDGYTGVLVIDGVELPTIDIDDLAQQFDAEPGQQIDLPATTIFEPGNFTLTFVPSDAALVKKFDVGLHRAEVIYWKVTEGRQRPHSYNWTFTVV